MSPTFNSELFAHQLAGYSDFCKVQLVFEKGEVVPRVNVQSGFVDKLPLPPLRPPPEERMKANRETINYFYEQFGRDRVLRIGERYRIAFQNKYRQGAALRVRDVRRLFVGMADVRRDDLLEAFNYRRLAGTFTGARYIEDLTDDDVDTLLADLIPFPRVEEIFLYRLPEVDPAFLASGVTFDSRQQAIYLLEDLRRRRKTLSQEEWAIRMAKRLTNAQLPKGTLLAHRLGYYWLWDTISGEGAYKDCWKTLTRSPDPSFKNLISYRGTRFMSLAKDGPQTAIEDLRPDLGCRGIMATYGRTRDVLYKPDLGFVSRADEKVWVIGMSLGGAHVQRDACLFLEKFEHITTVSSVGIDEPTLAFFKRRADEMKEKVWITHIVDHDDVIPDFCDGHIGVDVGNTENVTIRHLTYQALPTLTQEERDRLARQGEMRGVAPDRPISGVNMLTGIFHMHKSLRGPHLREPHGQDHLLFVLGNQTEEERARLNKVLHNKGDQRRANWEVWRRLVARFGRPLEFINFAEDAWRRRDEKSPRSGT